MYINQKWDYPTMEVCATKLDELCNASKMNKLVMDSAFETLVQGVQAQVGKVFMAAYSEHVSSIQLFTQVLIAEVELLRKNSNAMQLADDEIAAKVRSMFSL